MRFSFLRYPNTAATTLIGVKKLPPATKEETEHDTIGQVQLDELWAEMRFS